MMCHIEIKGKKSALRSAPESDEGLLGMAHEYQTLHVLGWVEREEQDVLGAGQKRNLVCHGHVSLPDVTAAYSDASLSLSLPLYDARTPRPACRPSQEDSQAGSDPQGGGGLRAVGRVFQRLTRRKVAADEDEWGDKQGLGADWWTVALPDNLVKDIEASVMAGESRCGAEGRTSVVFEARGCWWETEVSAEVAGVDGKRGNDEMVVGMGAGGVREVRVRLPWERKCLGSVDVQLLHTRTQQEKQLLESRRQAEEKILSQLHRLVSHCEPNTMVNLSSEEEEEVGGLRFPQALTLAVPAPRAVPLAPLYRTLFRAGVELQFITSFLRRHSLSPPSSTRNEEWAGESCGLEEWEAVGSASIRAAEASDSCVAREVVVDMLVAKGRTLLVHIFSGLVEEVLAAGRDLDIEPSKPPPEKPTDEWKKGVLAEEEARQDKCELLAEVVVRFFDAAKNNLQGTLDSAAAAAKGVGDGGQEAHHIWLFLMGIRSALRKLSGPKDEGGGGEFGGGGRPLFLYQV